MKIGSKIAQLRNASNLSQEELGEILSVSRQSISHWEGNITYPSLDKLLQICNLFHVSADHLLHEDEQFPEKAEKCVSKKYFGTDGFRGEANISLTSMQAYRVGRFLGWYFRTNGSVSHHINSTPRIVIGKDTRRSSYMLEYSIAAGITASGGDVYMLHVTTTPSVSFVTRQDEFDCGIMITASHNPYTDNGIKLINRYGEKMEDSVTQAVEHYLNYNLKALGVEDEDLPLAAGEQIGRIIDYVSGRNRYVGYLISLASNSYKSLRIGLDCANGSSWMIAKAVFDALGAHTYVMGNEPNGLNVNLNCGSTHIDALCRMVKDNHLDMGFAFDGDADRCIAVDENGNVVDGDAIMYILAKRLRSRGMLNENTVAATVMSNSGFVATLKKEGFSVAETKVGDRFVYECMQEHNYGLGGEQSGHIILRKYATTGDGILTAIMLTEEVCDRKSTLASLAEPLLLFPQLTKNIRTPQKSSVMKDADVLALVARDNEELSGRGRVLLRESGTEPMVRILVEAETDALCSEYAEAIASLIEKKGYIHD